MIRHAALSVSPLAMDQPPQHVSRNSCQEKREQRVLCHPVGHGSLALADVPVCLWVLFACLPSVVLALTIYVTGYTRCLIGNIVQGFPHLIQDLLG
jgi:hypothetical protein